MVPALTSDRAALVGSTRGRSLWGYVVTAVGAATFSSVITWNVATRIAQVTPPPVVADASVAAVDPPPVLWVPDDAPQEEPPPPPLASGAEASPALVGAGRDGSGAAATSQRSAAEEVAGTGTLRINSVPEGAEVYIQRKLIGKTPLELNEQPLDTDVKVELRLPGYQKKKKRLHWNGKTELDVTLKLDEEKTDEPAEGASEKPSASPQAAPPSEPAN